MFRQLLLVQAKFSTLDRAATWAIFKAQTLQHQATQARTGATAASIVHAEALQTSVGSRRKTMRNPQKLNHVDNVKGNWVRAKISQVMIIPGQEMFMSAGSCLRKNALP